jgi:hypothetical protein
MKAKNTDDLLPRIIGDIREVERLGARREDIAVLATPSLMQRLSALYGDIFCIDGLRIKICGYPVRKCSGPGDEYFITIKHTVLSETPFPAYGGGNVRVQYDADGGEEDA